MNISLSAFAPENLVSRDGFGSPVPRQPAHLHTQDEYDGYLRDCSRVPRRRPFIYLNMNFVSLALLVYDWHISLFSDLRCKVINGIKRIVKPE